MSEAGHPHVRSLLRQIPSVDDLLQEEAVQGLLRSLPRALVVETIREVVATRREALVRSPFPADPTAVVAVPSLVAEVVVRAREKARPHLRRVINATGVILHTNLGRAPLAAAALAAVTEVARSYSTLEYDVARGVRGSRQAAVAGLLSSLTGAEAALVVNNNAAAVLLAINTLAEGKEVIVSRGQLVEIGDSFRIPDIMQKAGGLLREVGTTNRTTPRDYEKALSPSTALLLKVHTSNFRILGFTREVTAAELVTLGRRHGLPVMEDLGSGALIDLSRIGLAREPLVADSVRAGVDLVTFSGDKLLGGPQAGIIVGRRDLIERLRMNPLARAVRSDKLTLAALEATLRLYQDEERVVEALPVLRALALPLPEVTRRARELAKRIAGLPCGVQAEVEEEFSEVGGGALPLERIPTAVVVLRHPHLSAVVLEERLRTAEPPVLGRIVEDRLLLDPRSLLPGEEEEIVQVMAERVGEQREAQRN